VPATQRVANHHRRMRDTHAPAFVRKYRAQSLAIAWHDNAGERALSFIESTYEWPKP